MFITQKEIQNFHSQVNISPNIVFNVIQSLSDPSKSNTSIRINYIINENDEILFNINKEDKEEKFISSLFYEIFIIKIDFIRNKSKMIMIYNNENKEYKIKIWASKLEKVEIKNEYNKIVKKLCEKKTGNNILKNILHLKPDKYTIYYFPVSISLFEKELVFIYILILTQNEKSKFKNFKQIKDLISYSKSFLIPKINDLLYIQNKNKTLLYDSNTFIKTNNNNDYKLFHNDNKENIIINHISKGISYISPKNKEIKINFNVEKFKKILRKKRKSNKNVKPVNFLKKPYNKIVFNYSFEKNDNNNNNSNLNTNSTTLNKIKSYRDHFNEQRNQINTIIINTNRSNKSSNNYVTFPINRLNDENININNSLQQLPFSFLRMNNSTKTIPYSKKRPSSIPKRIMHYLSTNNYSLQNKKMNCEKDNELIKSYCSLNHNQLSCKNRTKEILYKRKSFSKKKNQRSMDLNTNYFLQKINCLHSCEINSSLDNMETYLISNSHNNNNNIFDKENNNCIILNKNRRNDNLIYNSSITTINPLIKAYNFKKDNNNKNKNKEDNNNNINKIPINRKATLKFNFRNAKLKDDIRLNLNNGNRTSRNVMNEKSRRELLYKHNTGDKNEINRDSQTQKLNDGDEEISLFL